jgi:hypothetical protein
MTSKKAGTEILMRLSPTVLKIRNCFQRSKQKINNYFALLQGSLKIKRSSAHKQKVLIKLIDLQNKSSGDAVPLKWEEQRRHFVYFGALLIDSHCKLVSLETTTFNKCVAVLYIKRWTAVQTFYFYCGKLERNHNKCLWCQKRVPTCKHRQAW